MMPDNRLDETVEQIAEQASGQKQRALYHGERQRRQQHVAPPGLLQGDAGAQRDGETVGAERERQQQGFKYGHTLPTVPRPPENKAAGTPDN